MLLLFLVLTYALTWTMFIIVAVAVPARTLPGYLMVLAGAYAPAMVALPLTWRERGRDGVRELLGRILITDAPVRLYVLAVTYMAAIKLATALLHRAISGAWPRFETGSLLLIPWAIAFSTPFQAGEEIGWRGFALPRLADRFGLRAASLLLGVIWAMWHVPQFYIADADTYHQSFPVWGAQVVAISVAMAWLYARSGGSLLLPMLMHAAINNTKDIVPAGRDDPHGVFSLDAPAVAWLALALMWIAAFYFLARMPSTTIGAQGDGNAQRPAAVRP